MSNILDGSISYLIGSIDNAADQGRGWRKHLVSLCSEKGLKIKFLDPTNKITGLKEEVGSEHSRIMTLKNQQRYDELSETMRTIVRQDHRCVDLSDFVIFLIDTNIHTCGSYFEFQSSLTQKKPYFIIVPEGKQKTPAWLFGICDHNNIYNSVEDVVDRLIKLNSGEIPLSDRWVLFRKQIKNM